MVRSEFEKGGGVPSLIAVNDNNISETAGHIRLDGINDTFNLGLAYAKGIGGTRAGVILTTITDVFGFFSFLGLASLYLI